MNTLIDTLRYFVLITIELIALFVFISALVEIILMYVPEEKIRRRLSGAGVFGAAQDPVPLYDVCLGPQL